MSKYRKWRNAALVLTALVIVAQVGVSVLARTKRARGYLAAHLERTFGRPVEVAQWNVEILPRLRLDAEGVSVGEDPAFGHEYFLRAEHLSASLRWTGLLRGHFEFGTLSLSRPSLILVRNAQGRWNLEKWLPPAPGNALAMARVYGPHLPVAPVNRLQKIEVDEGRIDFKNGLDKAPFAFTGVSGGVEQVSPGRWELHLEAQPWRSGVELQSTGTMQVRGDLAGTSTRLQPAEISVHWDRVSLADMFRLLRGEDYSVRGVFALDATAKSGPPSAETTASLGAAPDGAWTFAVQARASKIHRWDLAERTDNPRVNLHLKGSWNPSAGTLRADELSVETPQSNLRGTVSFSSGGSPEMELRVDSAGIQAADLLPWYRAFYFNVDEGMTVEQYFTGGMRLRGWPAQLEVAAFSSRGGILKVPGVPAPIRIGAVEGGGDARRFVIEPLRISFDEKNRSAAPVAPRKRGAPDLRNAAEIAFARNFETHSGALSVDWRADKTEDLLKLAAVFGRQMNRGWELTGASNAALRWDRSGSSSHGLWNGRIDFTGAELQAAGLNQPLKFKNAGIEWKGGKRTAEIVAATGFDANWSGEISEAIGSDADGGEDDRPNWKFRLHADHLNAADLDRWIGPRARPNWLQRVLAPLLGGTAPNSAASELLRRVRAEGTLNADELTVEKLNLRNVQAEGVLRDLKVDVTRSEAQWAGGKVRAAMRAAFYPRPKYDVTAELEEIRLTELPATAVAGGIFGGVASGTVHLTTAGVGREELLQMLAGKGEVRLKNAEFRGWDVNASVDEGAPRTGTSQWASGQGAFALRDRSILIDRLKLDAGREQTIVDGTVSFARQARLTVETVSLGKSAKRTAEISGPARVLTISGRLDALKISVANPTIHQPAD